MHVLSHSNTFQITMSLAILIFFVKPVFSMMPFMNRNRVVSLEGQAQKCHGGLCGGMAHYPAKPGIHYYATFNVPELPEVWIQRLDNLILTQSCYLHKPCRYFENPCPVTGKEEVSKYNQKLFCDSTLCLRNFGWHHFNVPTPIRFPLLHVQKMDGITYFIYFNIFFGNGPKNGDGRMNQACENKKTTKCPFPKCILACMA